MFHLKKKLNLNFLGAQTMTNINIELPDDLHRKLKMHAAEKGITLKEFITEVLKENG